MYFQIKELEEKSIKIYEILNTFDEIKVIKRL